MTSKFKLIGALITCLAGSQLAAQTGPPPAPPPPPQPAPNAPEPPPRNPGPEGPNERGPTSWYNGDYVPGSISSILMIDDPVTGFGNEALWTDPPSVADPEQSDIAGSSAPD